MKEEEVCLLVSTLVKHFTPSIRTYERLGRRILCSLREWEKILHLLPLQIPAAAEWLKRRIKLLIIRSDYEEVTHVPEIMKFIIKRSFPRLAETFFIPPLVITTPPPPASPFAHSLSWPERKFKKLFKWWQGRQERRVWMNGIGSRAQISRTVFLTSIAGKKEFRKTSLDLQTKHLWNGLCERRLAIAEFTLS
jgi:hypothetical protein